jgi:GT2 family glycosyltransferase
VSFPRVTVVTPSYNQGEYLEQTICSVLDQRYPNLEYFIVDGGSTDGSVKIIRRYEPFLAWWVSEPDRGQSHAINKGWQRSTGEILAFLNSDDLYLKGAIHSAATALTRHSSADLAYGRARVFDPNGALYETHPPQPNLRNLIERNYIQQPTVFLRRTLAEKIGWLDEDLHYCFDYDYWLRAAVSASFARVPAITAAIRIHAASKTGSQQSCFARERMAVLDRLFAAHPVLDLDLELKRRACLRDALCAVGLRSNFSPEERDAALVRVQQLRRRLTVSELTAILADWDLESSEGLLAGLPAESEQADRWPVDGFGILPALVDAGLLSVTDAERAERRAAAYRALRAGVRRRRWHQASRRLVGMAIRNPQVLATRAWWGSLARSSSLGSRLLASARDVRGRERRTRSLVAD